MSDFSRSFLTSLPNASKPALPSPPADLSTTTTIASTTTTTSTLTSPILVFPQPPPPSTSDDYEWHTVKAHLKKIGFCEPLLQAMENDCPSYEVLNAFIKWTETQKKQETALSTSLVDTRSKLDAMREEMKEAATLRDIEYGAMTKRLKAAQTEADGNKAKADKLEAALKQERDDRSRISSELASRDLVVMELTTRVQQLEGAGDVAALTAINKNLAANQVTLKKDIFTRDKQIEELKLEIETLKTERDKMVLDIKVAQDQAAQWKANCEEVRHSWRIQMDQMKRDHEKALQEAKMSSSSSSSSLTRPSSSGGSFGGDVLSGSDAEKVRKLEEILRLQRQITNKFQEQNEALREELNVKKTETATLYDEKMKLQRQLEEALLQLAMTSRKITNSSSLPTNLKIEAVDSTSYYGGSSGNDGPSSDFINKEPEEQAFAANNLYLMSMKATMKPEQQSSTLGAITSVEVIATNSNRDCTSSTNDPVEDSFSVMTNEEIAMMGDINDLQALKTINQQLCKKVSERTAKYFEMRKELQECQSCYTSICKQLQEAKKDLDEKDEYIITLRRRLRHCGQATLVDSTSNGQVLVSRGSGGADSTGLAAVSPVGDFGGDNNLAGPNNSSSNNNNNNNNSDQPPAKIFRRSNSNNYHHNSHQQTAFNVRNYNNNNSFQQRRRNNNFGNNSLGGRSFTSRH